MDFQVQVQEIDEDESKLFLHIPPLPECLPSASVHQHSLVVV
jgi:hypothetical protein